MLINGRYEEARELLTSIATFNGKKTPKGQLIAPHPDHKLTFIQQFKGIFTGPYLLLTLLLWTMWFCLSFGGWGYSYISPIAFDKLGTNPYLASLASSAIALLGNILVMLFVDRFPRKPLLIVGFLTSGILTSVAGVYSHPIYLVVMMIIVNFISTAPYVFDCIYIFVNIIV